MQNREADAMRLADGTESVLSWPAVGVWRVHCLISNYSIGRQFNSFPKVSSAWQ